MPRIYLLVLYSLITFQSRSQLEFTRIDGLSQNTVYSIMQDKLGFMWVATANGLNRYDGTGMKIYKPSFKKSIHQISGKIIRSAILEKKDTLWFSVENSISFFAKKSQVFAEQKISLSQAGKSILPTVPDKQAFANPLLEKDGNIWFASPTYGLFKITSDRKCANYPVPFNNSKGQSIQLMYNGCYSNGCLWFVHEDGLLAFDLTLLKWQTMLAGTSFYSIAQNNDTLYLGSPAAISWFSIKDKHHAAMPVTAGNNKFKSMMRCIYVDGSKRVWAGDHEGNVFCKQPSSNAFVWQGNINGSNAVTKFPVYCFYADTVGNLWVGADVLGLLKANLNPKPFRTYPDSGSSKGNLFVYSMMEEGDSLWVGTYQSGIKLLSKKTGKSSNINFNKYADPLQLYGNSVPLIQKDAVGNIWTSSHGYLFVREAATNGFKAIKLPIVKNAIQVPQLWCMSNYGNGWLLGTNIGLFEMHKKNGRYTVVFLENIGVSKVLNLQVMPDGKKLWIIPENGGIHVLDSVHAKINRKLFADESARSVEYDSYNNLYWICTTNGLIAYHLPTEKFSTYSEQDGMLNSQVYGIIPCGNECWISTNQGLARGRLIKKDNSLLPKIVFTNFTVDDGLPYNEFNRNAYYKGKSGNLYFGTANGVVWFKPESIGTSKEKSNLQVLGLLVNNQPIDSSIADEYLSEIDLPYSSNNLFIRFRNIGFTNPEKTKYAFQLEGWDKAWIENGNIGEARYSNLPPGNYTFKIKATNGSGTWEQEVRKLHISIQPPYWKTWWFYTLIALLVVTIIIAITWFYAQQTLKVRVMELEKQHELDMERQRISREMHDDIGAGLTQISLMSEAAKMSNTATHELEDIATTSRKLVGSMGEIIWSLNANNSTLEQVNAYLREQLNKQLEYAGIAYSIQLDESQPNLVLSNQQKRNILLVAKELLNNAIKYSRATNIFICMKMERNMLLFEIKDDGIGFDTTKQFHGNGLRNIKYRIEELGGQLNMESGEAKGTTFAYSIPLK